MTFLVLSVLVVFSSGRSKGGVGGPVLRAVLRGTPVIDGVPPSLGVGFEFFIALILKLFSVCFEPICFCQT